MLPGVAATTLRHLVKSPSFPVPDQRYPPSVDCQTEPDGEVLLRLSGEGGGKRWPAEDLRIVGAISREDGIEV